jgi:hypothetical protein
MASQSTLSFSSPVELDYTVPPANLPPAEIQYRGRRWGLIKHRPNKGKGSRRSPIWDIADEYQALNDSNKRAWRCRVCTRDNIVGIPEGRTGAATRHISLKHNMVVEGEEKNNHHSDVASTVSVGTTNCKPNIARSIFNNAASEC